MKMKRDKLSETWIDDTGTVVAVLTADGTYRVFVDPDNINISTFNGLGKTTDIQRLSEMGVVAQIVIDVKTSILHAKSREIARRFGNR